MAAHTTHQPPGLVELSDGLATVIVAPAIGGAIASFRWATPEGPIDWFRPTPASALVGHDAGELGCFPLVPYSNRIRDSRFVFGGRQVDLMGQRPADPHFEHGYGWRRPWSIVTQAADRLVIRYTHDRDAWPWRFAAEQEISVAGGELSVRLSLHNLDDSDMPAGLGLHPFFPAGRDTVLTASVEGMWRTDPDVLPTVHGGLLPDADPNSGLKIAGVALDTVFTGWAHTAEISWPETRTRLTMRAEAILGNLVLYTPPGMGYFCAEPVSNVTDAFNRPDDGAGRPGFFVLGAGEHKSALVQFVPAISD